MTYEVVMLNNDITPFDFAMEVLTDFFEYSVDDALQKAMEVHNEDLPQVIATYDSYDEAMQKVNVVMTFIRNNNDTLHITVR